MVANYPYFGLPNYMRYMNPSAYKNIQQQKQEYIRNNSRAQPQNKNPYYSTPYTQNNRQNSQASMNSPKKEKAKQQESPPLFSFFGINLYYDDVLILCILFFLYNEKVNDPYLFFTLVLLLLT